MRGPGGQAEAFQDPPDRIGRMNCCKYSHSASAAITLENVHFPHTFHQLGPEIVPWTGTARLGRLAASRLFSSAASIMACGFCLRCERDDRRSPASCGRKQPMIPYEIKHGRRNQGRELRHKLQRFEHDMRRAVAPSVPETIEQQAIRQDRQTLRSFSRTPRVSAEILQLAAGF